ncbi:MAG: membrane protein FxsA [Chitinivibrionales bacterium]|nr:membrane protein FxsA [Chitinivibrionales bacterium]
MLTRLLLLFTLVPLLELYLLFKFGSYFGFLVTIAVVIGTGVLGAWLAKQQGLVVWLRIQNETSQGRFPAGELIDGLLLLVAGVVLLTPGILTDALGLLLLFPSTRRAVKSWVTRRLQDMMRDGNVHISGFFR